MSQSAPRIVRVGVVGLGFGAAVHAPALLALPNVAVVGIAGRDGARAQAAADKLGIAKGYGSIDALLGAGLDAITLALPTDQVEEAVRASLKAGVAVLCEKPLGQDAGVAQELAVLAQNKVTAMDFIFGELAVFQRLQQAIDGGQYGKVRHAQLTWLTESWAHRSRQWSWKNDAAQGGGVLPLFGSHVFFLAEWLFGKATQVNARMGEPVAKAFAPVGASAAEDLVHCHLRHESGAEFAAVFGNANPGITVHRWTVVFEKATIVLENTSADYIAGFTLTISEHGKVLEQLAEPVTGADGRLAPFGSLAQRFLQAVREGGSMSPDFATGARVQVIDAAVRASALSGKDVAIAG